MTKRSQIIMLTIISLTLFITTPARAYEDIAEVWTKAEMPPPPELVEVSVNAADTALLILDIEELTCNEARRPRCLETVPRIAAFLSKARKAGMPVAHSLTPRGTPDTILPPVKPIEGEPIAQASVNKFYNTQLDAFLKENNIKRVIVCGTAAHGAVLHTATAVGQRKLELILPVDGLSAASLYTEQAAVQLLKTGPGTRRNIKLTRFKLISINP